MRYGFKTTCENIKFQCTLLVHHWQKKTVWNSPATTHLSTVQEKLNWFKLEPVWILLILHCWKTRCLWKTQNFMIMKKKHIFVKYIWSMLYLQFRVTLLKALAGNCARTDFDKDICPVSRLSWWSSCASCSITAEHSGGLVLIRNSLEGFSWSWIYSLFSARIPIKAFIYHLG